jgi:hypothetical protein
MENQLLWEDFAGISFLPGILPFFRFFSLSFSLISDSSSEYPVVKYQEYL